jgi:flagellar motility protein MotE (MotC chaperone)
MRPRLVPSVILAASMLLGIKLVDLWAGGGAAIATAWAQSAAATAPPPAVPGDAAKGAAPPPTPAAPATAPAPRDPLQMSAEEIGELQQLAKRRGELDKRAGELREREVLMQAAEQRIDEKIAKLEALDKSIKAEVNARDQQDDARLESLTHMYEQMKPQDAARILDQLDLTVVVSLMSHMREMKAAPILATMDAAKAKAVTMALAVQHRTPADPPAAAPPPNAP